MTTPTGNPLARGARKTAKSFGQTAPVLIGVLLLAGLLDTLVLPPGLMDRLAGDTVLGPVAAAVLGSISAGHPITSYVMGGELLAKGVGLEAVTALIVSWVTVGVVQLPVEAAHLGRRFALVRNLLAFVSALVIAFLTALTVGGLGS